MDMINKKSLTFEIQKFHNGENVGVPVNYDAKKTCKLLNTVFLTAYELKVLELIGYDLKYKPQKIPLGSFYVRGKY
jgi:hypothetical protein